MTTMTHERVLYTAKTHTTGGRDGESRSSDGRLDGQAVVCPVRRGTGTNPEQLFAAGWSACFEGAMGGAARKMKVALPPDRGDRCGGRPRHGGRRVLCSRLA